MQKEDFDVGFEIKNLTANNTKIGGVASFIGFVRDYAKDQKISSIMLEHYPGMTEKQLKKIEKQAKTRWDLQEILIVHRYGVLTPGDQIVLVVTSSPHRQDALQSCQFLIDWLKTKAPFWKLETGDKSSTWVSERESDIIAADRWTNTLTKDNF